MPENIEKYLLTPGPLTTSKLTKEAMLRDIGSWDSDFKKITSEIREKLVNILMQTSNINKIKNSDPYISIPMQGSGTFSVEAMLGTFVPKTNKALVLSNGSYGKRCSTILNYLGRENDIIDMGDFLPPDPQLLEKN